jgi:hypothetical protein
VDCVKIGGVTVRLGGMAKGSGMIHPNMATMLGVSTITFWFWLIFHNFFLTRWMWRFHGPPNIGFSLGPDALFGSYDDCDCTPTDYRDDILNWDYCTIYVLIVKHWRRLQARFCRWWLVMQMWLWMCGDLLCWRLSNAASTKSQYFQESSLFDNLGFWVWGMCAFSENNSLLVSCLKLSYSNKASGWVGGWVYGGF